MPKYEIMLILDSKADEGIVSKISNDVFKAGKPVVEKLPRTELAYEINGAKTAKYFLIKVDTQPSDIKEFTRKANIEKAIWRFMAINLDTEKKDKKPRKNFKRREESTEAPVAE